MALFTDNPSMIGPLTTPNTTSQVDAQNETVQGRIGGLLQTDDSGNYLNPVVQQSQNRQMQAFNQRGLLNSSVAVQGGTEAAISKAIDIATPDAATYYNNRRANVDTENKFAEDRLGAEVDWAKQQSAQGSQAALQASQQAADLNRVNVQNAADLQRQREQQTADMQRLTTANDYDWKKQLSDQQFRQQAQQSDQGFQMQKQGAQNTADMARLTTANAYDWQKTQSDQGFQLQRQTVQNAADLQRQQAQNTADLAKQEQQQGFTASQTQSSQAYNLRDAYQKALQNIDSNFQRQLDTINASNMKPEDKTVAIQQAQAQRDGEIAFQNNLYSHMPQWQQEWTNPVVSTNGMNIASITNLDMLANIANDPAQPPDVRAQAQQQLQAMQAPTAAAPAAAVPQDSMLGQSAPGTFPWQRGTNPGDQA